MPDSVGAVTRLLGEMRNGNVEAAPRLLELIHAELRRLAARYMRQESPRHTLQPTALVNEAYIRLLGHEPQDWQNRSHFFAHAARAMRQILVDYARRRRSDKRGGGQVIVSLDEITSESDEPVHQASARPGAADIEDLIDLDAALTKLAILDPRQAQIVELRFFGGLDDSDIARAVGVSMRTVRRDWRVARLWLHHRMRKDGRPSHGG